MEALELIDEGTLDPNDRRHTCPRCGEVARYMGRQVYVGALVALTCPDGHRWTICYLDLPAAVLAPVQAAA
jgi:hypothetical protein